MHKPALLITGGAGYIGSHCAFHLASQGYQVVVLDIARTKPMGAWATFVHGDFSDTILVSELLRAYNIQAVIHCAAFIQVGESVSDPLKYYMNNVAKTIALLQTMLAHNVKKLIFSSSAAVYGTPSMPLLDENHPPSPINPYGTSKLMIEQVMSDMYHAYGLNFVALRYFNVAGAWAEHNLGECHIPETHIIPLMIQACVQEKPFTLYGADYETPDGTCIRDYVHVGDVAYAHERALAYLLAGQKSDFFNIGTGQGRSIRDLANIVQQVVGKPLKLIKGPRRAGDPSMLVASIQKAQLLLAWEPLHRDLDQVISSAYAYQRLRAIPENALTFSASHIDNHHTCYQPDDK